MLEEANKRFPYKYSNTNDLTYRTNEDLKEFVADPVNEDYLRLAKELKEKNIKAKLVRDILFEEQQ